MPGVIFGAEIAEAGNKEKTREISNPLPRIPLIRIPK
jgi:hypothetical protein